MADNAKQEARPFNPPAALVGGRGETGDGPRTAMHRERFGVQGADGMIPLRNGTAGGAMDANVTHGETGKPTKEQVRAWLARRLAQPMPLPSLEQIRQELGWATEERPLSVMSDQAEKTC